MANVHRLIERLAAAKRDFRPGSGSKVEQRLRAAEACEFTDPEDLSRFHEVVLFFRAYPQGPGVKRMAEGILRQFGERVLKLKQQDSDLDGLEEEEVAGISGTGVSAVFSYGLARDLVARWGEAIEIDWASYESQHHLGRELPQFVPLLPEDAMVEAAAPYREWLVSASNGVRPLAWLMDRLDGMPFVEAARIYESLELMVRWNLRRSSATRTLARLPARRTYYHRGPLLRRADVDLARILEGPPSLLDRLERSEGERFLRVARDTSAVRYRELHGFTFGDAGRVRRADLGRGAEMYITVVPPERRLPLRAYHGAMLFKNGVPVGYVEGLSLFERMEVGFNLYYTFREGETAWLYAQTMRVFRHAAGVRTFWVDPYQIGHKNEEAIESGAFWFYRKLGFRPVRLEPARLCAKEESKMARKASYRSSAAVLRRLVGPMVYESHGSEAGVWDEFELRRVGFAVQNEMARRFSSDRERLAEHTGRRLKEQLGIDPSEIARAEGVCTVAALIPDLDDWTPGERRLLAEILRAKARPDESDYLRLLQRHARLREYFLQTGRRA